MQDNYGENWESEFLLKTGLVMQQTGAQAVTDFPCRNIKGVALSVFSTLNVCVAEGHKPHPSLCLHYHSSLYARLNEKKRLLL